MNALLRHQMFFTVLCIILKAYQKHFRCTMDGPDSSYSCFDIHICWKVDSDARMDPPIHTEYFLSGGAIILIFIDPGASSIISLCIRSVSPVNKTKY